MYIIFALLGALFASFAPIFQKRIISSTNTFYTAWISQAAGLPVLTIAIFYSHIPSFDVYFIIYCLSASLVSVIAVILTMYALSKSDASIIAPFTAVNPVVSLLIAIALIHEKPSLFGMVGVILVFVGMILISFSARLNKTKKRNIFKQKNVIIAFIAGSIFSLSSVLQKNAILHSNPHSPIFTGFVIILINSICLLSLLLLKSKKQKFFKQKGSTLFLAICSGCNVIFAYTALATGFVGYVSAILNLSCIFTII